ncbi:hypothetical protein EAI_02617 [Harpegnathos saltator]|uniref:Uncharacterized protein n=1 Tax=Harpegnathos saltator TaxID=610380 RepID=E2BAI3_HARSA|nr:hypothetical protein EAI_02617 [Harpegnathos saltator]
MSRLQEYANQTRRICNKPNLGDAVRTTYYNLYIVIGKDIEWKHQIEILNATIAHLGNLETILSHNEDILVNHMHKIQLEQRQELIRDEIDEHFAA